MPATPLPSGFFPFLRHFIRPLKFRFACAMLFSLGWAFDQTIFPYAMKLLVDALQKTPAGSPDVMATMGPALWFFGIVWVVAEIFYRLQGLASMWVMPEFTARIRMAVTDYVAGHSYSYFADHFAGAVANKISDLPRSANAFLQMLMTVYIPSLAALIISCAILTTVDPVFAVVLALWFAVHLGICFGFARACDQAGSAHSETQSILQGKVVDMLTNNVNMRLFGRRRFEMRYLETFQEDERRANLKALWVMEKVRFILTLNSIAGIIFLMLVLIERWQTGSVTLGQTILLLNSTFNIMMMAWMSGVQLPGLFREIGIVKQALSVISAPHTMPDKMGAVPLVVSAGEIRFDDVRFGYQEIPLFDGLSVTIPAGQKVGLVGFSGSGKSSFTHLLLRYYDVQQGRITIDEQNISDVKQDSLRRQIAMIPQDTTLFHRSLMENIRYGRPEATDDEVITAARLAHCDEFIAQLEMGYRSLVGERGIKLSVGQRQRVAIARAILKNAPIVILDEATSALDSVTEHLIQKSLQELIRSRTAIVIAHRLSTLYDMDRILVFQKGRIIEDGSHGELLTADGHYAMLWRRQVAGFLPEADKT